MRKDMKGGRQLCNRSLRSSSSAQRKNNHPIQNDMNIPLVLTIIRPDRTGLVESLPSLVAEHGGNWLESRMSHLGGQFAGILRIHVPADREQPLVTALKNLRNLSVVVQVDRSAA